MLINGNNFIGDGSRMVVTFHHAIAEIVTASDTALGVVVPEGALTGNVLVCIASDICSNPFPFGITFGPTFQDISSIAYETGTNSLWVADRGTADTVYEIDDAEVLHARGGLNQAILGHPSPSDGTGRIYYSNSLVSEANFGTIEYVDSVTNAEVFFDRAGDSAGQTVPVRCEGIAATDLEPNVAYCLDGRGNTVRRITMGAFVHDLTYGDQPFVFNSPSGARFDSEGNLYLSSTTEIYKILPDEAAVELVASGFTAAAGIDLIEDGDETLLAVADEATGEVWLVNPDTTVQVLVADGFSGPVGVAFAADPAAGKTGLYVAEPTRLHLLPDPRMEFLVDTDQRILLSKTWSYDVYPSPDQTADREIAVRVRLNPMLDPTGRSAHFRLVDPMDPSGYIENAANGDNLPSEVTSGDVTAEAPFDASGVAVATLSVHYQYSGNNYRVEAGLAGGGDFRPLAISPVFTTWRRAYIEHDFMYRQGEWIVMDSGAGQLDPNRVFVADPLAFTLSEEVHVLSGESFDTANGEFGTVAAIGPDYVDVAPFDPDPQTGGLRLFYGSAQAPAPNDQDPFSFLARIGPGVYGEALGTAPLTIAFDDAFAEWLVLPTAGFVPSWPFVPGDTVSIAGDYITARSPGFFNAELDPTGPGVLNTVQLVSAAGGEFLGLAQSAPSLNWAWVYNEAIAADYPGAVEAALESVTAHELAHLFDVNNPPGNGGHDSEESWTPPGNLCLMNPARDRTLGVVKLHAPLGASTNALMCIRTHIDDLNSAVCGQP